MRNAAEIKRIRFEARPAYVNIRGSSRGDEAGSGRRHIALVVDQAKRPAEKRVVCTGAARDIVGFESVNQDGVSACARQKHIELLARGGLTALPDLRAVHVIGAVIDVHIEVVISVCQFVEHGKAQIELIGGNVDQVRCYAVGRTECEGLGRVLINEAVDKQRFAQAMNAG